MNPEDLFDPETLPDDLQWVARQYRLQPDDPVFLVVAWHWARVGQAEDTLRALTLELKTSLSSRVDEIQDAADRVERLQIRLAALEAAISEKPSVLARRWDSEFHSRLEIASAALRTLQASAAAALSSVERAGPALKRHEFLAGAIAGAAVGLALAVLLALR